MREVKLVRRDRGIALDYPRCGRWGIGRVHASRPKLEWFAETRPPGRLRL
jgi:hypothetical protein